MARVGGPGLLILLIGLPGAGKSTLAAALAHPMPDRSPALVAKVAERFAPCWRARCGRCKEAHRDFGSFCPVGSF